MYILKRNGRSIKAFNYVFDSYERARQAARKHLRTLAQKGKVDKFHPTSIWDGISRNPSSIKEYGYTIERV